MEPPSSTLVDIPDPHSVMPSLAVDDFPAIRLLPQVRVHPILAIPDLPVATDSASLPFDDAVPFPTIEPRPFDAKELPRQKKWEEQSQLASLSTSASYSSVSSVSPSAPVPAIAAAVAAAQAKSSKKLSTQESKQNKQSKQSKHQHHSTPFHNFLFSIAAITSHCHSHSSPKCKHSLPNIITSSLSSSPSSTSSTVTATKEHYDSFRLQSPTADNTHSKMFDPLSACSFSSTSTIMSTASIEADTPPSSISRSSSVRSIISSYEKPFCQDRDAGNRPLDHYKSRLPPLRNKLRNAILPIVRWETPYLAAIQKRLRNPALDIFFALSANLGTHTCYVVMLPIAFWYGYSHFGRELVFVLAFGVYITNFIKDLLCLPRPLSPPLHRLTMSGSAALEYGFPSTHTANAVSVSLLVAQVLVNSRETFTSSTNYFLLHALNLFYVFTIVAGRIYCGMHGFLDVIGGLVIGIALWWVRFLYGDAMDAIILSSGYKALWIIPVVIALVRIHPEPVDDCPCFDDGVAFLGVVAGCVVGEWHFTSTVYAAKNTSYQTIPFSYSQVGLLGALLRFLIGIILISVWRPVIKRALHEALPPLYRFLEKCGVSMPRRFFMPASQYQGVPSSLPDTTLFEPEKITSLFGKMRRAGRADSVGPQSTADVYESIAYREYQKQKFAADVNHRKPSSGTSNSSEKDGGLSSGTFRNDYYSTSEAHSWYNPKSDTNSHTTCAQEVQEDELMSQIVIPRTRYDVEVVTKLIVYSGIGLIAVDLCGAIFVTLGI